MARTIVKTCEMCGKKFNCQSIITRYCAYCRKIARSASSKNSYYKKKGIKKGINLEHKHVEKEKPKPMFIFSNSKYVCNFDNCPFKSGNRPCAFYFEYKDGTTSCPGTRFMK